MRIFSYTARVRENDAVKLTNRMKNRIYDIHLLEERKKNR